MHCSHVLYRSGGHACTRTLVSVTVLLVSVTSTGTGSLAHRSPGLWSVGRSERERASTIMRPIILPGMAVPWARLTPARVVAANGLTPTVNVPADGLLPRLNVDNSSR